MRQESTTLQIAACLVIELLATPVLARGNHYGWCRGVGNPHQSSQGCGQSGGSAQTGQTTGPTRPTANQLPPKGNPATPQSVAVPVLVPGAIPVPTPGQVPIATPVAVPQATPTPVVAPPIRPVPTPGQIPPVIATPNAIPQATPQATPLATATPTPRPNPVSGQVPTPVTAPTATPQATPQATPTPITAPQPIPVAVPGQTPQPLAQPNVTQPPKPAATHIAVPGHPNPSGTAAVLRPKPRPSVVRVTQPVPAQVTHHLNQRSEPKKHAHVARSPGRHDAHDLPRFRNGEDQEEWECVASGFGQRRYATERGQLLESGALRHLGEVDAMARDVPARHPKHAGCIISVKRRNR